MQSHRRIDVLVYVLFAFLAAVVYLPASPSRHPVPDRDAGVFLYVGDQMTRGAVPYRDIWDHKPIGVYLLPLVGFIITPQSLWGPWILAFFLLAFTAALGYKILQLHIGLPLSVSLICIWLFEMALFVRRDPFLAETTALPFQIGAFALAIWLARHPNTKRVHWAWFALGGSIAASALIKPPLAGLPCLATLIVLMNNQKHEKFEIVRWMVCGLLIPLLAVVSYLAINQAFEPFVDQVILYNFTYSGVTWHERAMAIWDYLITTSPISITAFIAWIIGLAFLRKNVSDQHRTFLLLLWFGWPLDLLISSISGRPYLHYFIGNFWLEIALLGWLLYTIDDYFSNSRMVLLLRGVFLGILSLSALQSWSIILRLETIGEAEQKSAILYIKNNVSDDLQILFWGAETSLYVATHRTAPTGIIYQYPLYTTGYDTTSVSQHFLDDIKRQTPYLIIDTSSTNPLIPPLDQEGYEGWRSPLSGYTPTSGGDAVKSYILENYVQIDFINSWPVYRYKSNDSK